MFEGLEWLEVTTRGSSQRAAESRAVAQTAELCDVEGCGEGDAHTGEERKDGGGVVVTRQPVQGVRAVGEAEAGVSDSVVDLREVGR